MTFGTTARLAALGLAATLAVGCEEKPATTPVEPTTATPVNPAAEPGLTPNLSNAKDSAAKTADAVTAKANEATAAADATAKDAGAKASAAGDTVVAQATKLYEDAKAAIEKLDVNSAQKYMDQLSSIKDKLPADWQTKVTALEQQFAAVKSKANAVSLPKVGQ